MLVLSRRADERVLFPHLGITVQVLQVKHNQVKLGIEAPPSVRVLRAELQQTPAKKCRTLIVDDDTNERELLAGLLAMNGCDCSTAADGLEALDYLAGHQRPDFVLMDMWMPRCDGRQTLHAIRGNPRFRDLKVFVVSGSSPQEAGIDPVRGGYDAWFQKPLNPSKLWEAIQRNLSTHD